MKTMPGCALLVALSVGQADAQSGVITYTRTTSLETEAPREMAAFREVFEARSRVPFRLYFQSSQSVMLPVGEPSRGEPPPVRFQLTTANVNALLAIVEAWYGIDDNVLKQAFTAQDGASAVRVLRSPAGTHRVATSPEPAAWEIGDEGGVHLGYQVIRATAIIDGEEAEAWFAPDIQMPVGPALHGGLPGVILVLSLNGGRTVYRATEVSLGNIDAEVIRMPDEGRLRSQDEYRSIVNDEIRQIRRVMERFRRQLGTRAECVVRPSEDRMGLRCFQRP